MKKRRRFLAIGLISLSFIICLGLFWVIAIWVIAFLGAASLVMHYSIYRYTYKLIPDRELSLRETLQRLYEHLSKKSILLCFVLILGLTVYGYWLHESITSTYFFTSLIIITFGTLFISASNGGPREDI